MKRDPSKKNMGRFYAGAAGAVLAAMACVVIIGRVMSKPGTPSYAVTGGQTSQPSVSEPAEPSVSVEPVETEPPVEPAEPVEETPRPGTEVLPDIVVPDTGVLVYRITRGDTLTYIQRMTGFTIQELADFNDVEDPNLIFTKHFLVMPQGVARDIIVDDVADVAVVLAGGEAASELSGPEHYAELARFVDMEEYRQRLTDMKAAEEAASSEADGQTAVEVEADGADGSDNGLTQSEGIIADGETGVDLPGDEVQSEPGE